MARENLTPEDGNRSANERAYRDILGPEHGGRVRGKGHGVTPTRYFASTIGGPGECSTSAAAGTRNSQSYDELLTEVQEMKTKQAAQDEKMAAQDKKMAEMLALLQQYQQQQRAQVPYTPEEEGEEEGEEEEGEEGEEGEEEEDEEDDD